MDFKLPDDAIVNKFIAKTKFYERASLNSRLQNEFINKIQKILKIKKNNYQNHLVGDF